MPNRVDYAVQIASALLSTGAYANKSVHDVVGKAYIIVDAIIERGATMEEIERNTDILAGEPGTRPDPRTLGQILLYGATPLSMAIARLCANGQVRGLCVLAPHTSNGNAPYAKTLRSMMYELIVGELPADRNFATLINCTNGDVPQRIAILVSQRIQPLEICSYFPDSPFVRNVVGAMHKGDSWKESDVTT